MINSSVLGYCFISPISLFLFFSHSHTLHQSSSSSSSSSSSAVVASKQKQTKEVVEEKMLLGKRPRPPMKRTTSLSEITFDLNTVADDVLQQVPAGVFNGSDQSSVLSTVSPRNHRRNSADFTNPPDFLRSCFLCKRPLVPGRDIYMYRGDSGFCSLECRQKQMNRDEKKDKSCVAVAGTSSKKQQPIPPISPSASHQSRHVNSKHETVVITKS